MSARRSAKPLFCAAVVVVCSLSVATVATAEPEGQPTTQPSASAIEEASARFRRAVQLYRDQEYRAALVEFEKAYEVAPSYRVLFNIAQVNVLLREYADARAAYTRFLEEGGAQVPAERREEVQKRLDELRFRVGRIRVTAPSGRQVLIDNRLVGHTPLEDVQWVNAGRRKVSILGGIEPFVRYIDVAGDEEVTVDVPEEKSVIGAQSVQPDIAKTEASTEVSKPRRRMGTAFWVSLGCTGALGIGALVSGLLALDAKSSFDGELKKVPNTAESIQSASDKSKYTAIATDALLGATAIAAAVTVYFGVRSLRSTEKEKPREGLSFRLGVGSAMVSGVF